MTLNLQTAIKVGFRSKIIEFLQREQNIVYANFIFALWNLIFIPLQIAFEIKFEGIFLAFEVLTMFYYISRASWYILNGIKGKKHTLEEIKNSANEKNTEEKLK